MVRGVNDLEFLVEVLESLSAFDKPLDVRFRPHRAEQQLRSDVVFGGYCLW